MSRRSHGALIALDNLQAARETLAGHRGDVPPGFAGTLPIDARRCDFLFPHLQRDPANFLIESRNTRDNLIRLGQTMHETNTDPGGDSVIPAAYTYFAQFVDHDISLDQTLASLPKLIDPELMPLTFREARNRLRNMRTAALDLESVYGPPSPYSAGKMQLGKVTVLDGKRRPLLRPAGKDDYNDLPRETRSGDIEHDRAPLTGDPRCDENTIIQQLHVAFLRAHNALVDQGRTFHEARAALSQHYQHIVIHDFLNRIADKATVDGILQKGNRFYDVLDEPFFVPLEFTTAAYRFGHCMVRTKYDFNLNFNSSGVTGTQPANLGLLFTFTALSGRLGDFDTLPENWIIEWENFVDAGRPFNKARRICTKLVEPLFDLPKLLGIPEQGDGARLAVRNLLRGYLMRVPTGQAVAEALGHSPLEPNELEAAAASPEQLHVLRETGFGQRTPLWYYILAEASARAEGQHLGPTGSALVAEVLIGLVRQSRDSILRNTDWKPTLPRADPSTFTLSDLLRLAGCLGNNAGEPSVSRPSEHDG